MRSLLSISRPTVAALIVIILAALGGWYVFLRGERARIAGEDTARGAGLAPPSFGGIVGSMIENVTSTFASPSGTPAADAAQLTNIARAPVSGIGFRTSGTTAVVLIERSTGNILEAPPGSNTLKRMSNTLVQNVFESTVMPSGKVIMRSIGDDGAIVTTVGTATSSADTNALVQARLPDGIRAIAASPIGEELFYIVETATGAEGFRARVDGSNERRVFSSAIAGWRALWLPSDRIVLAQHAADGIPGYALVIEKDGSTAPLLSNIQGLTVLPHPRSRALLWGESGSALSLYARVDDAATPVQLPIRTVADKCVWAPGTSLIAYCAVPREAPGANFLDRWYRGEMRTADAWWRVNVSAGTAEILYSPEGETFDVERPTMDENGEYIAFVNAIDDSPYLLRVSQ